MRRVTAFEFLRTYVVFYHVTSPLMITRHTETKGREVQFADFPEDVQAAVPVLTVTLGGEPFSLAHNRHGELIFNASTDP